MTAQTGWWFKLNESLNHHPASRLFGCFAKSLDVVGCPSWPGLLLNGNPLARFQRASVQRVAVTPGIASLNPGLMSLQPFWAAGLHAEGVKEISPR
jgi:hypothetical protein